MTLVVVVAAAALGNVRLRVRQGAGGVALAPRVRTGHTRPHRLLQRAQTSRKSIQ